MRAVAREELAGEVARLAEDLELALFREREAARRRALAFESEPDPAEREECGEDRSLAEERDRAVFAAFRASRLRLRLEARAARLRQVERAAQVLARAEAAWARAGHPIVAESLQDVAGVRARLALLARYVEVAEQRLEYWRARAARLTTKDPAARRRVEHALQAATGEYGSLLARVERLWDFWRACDEVEAAREELKRALARVEET